MAAGFPQKGCKKKLQCISWSWKWLLSLLLHSVDHTEQPSYNGSGCGYHEDIMRCGSSGAISEADWHNYHYSCADGAQHISEGLQLYWRRYGRIFEQQSLWTNKQNLMPSRMHLVTSKLVPQINGRTSGSWGEQLEGCGRSIWDLISPAETEAEGGKDGPDAQVSSAKNDSAQLISVSTIIWAGVWWCLMCLLYVYEYVKDV